LLSAAVGQDDPGAPVAAHQSQHPPVVDPAGQPVHQQPMVHRVEEALQIAIYRVPQTIAVGFFHLCKRHSRTAARTKSRAVRAEVRLEERADDLRDGLLNHSIQPGGNAQGTLPPGGFRNHHPQHSCRAIGALFQS
jgi:hypothetical protein